MGKVITMINEKGGVGKSSLVYNISSLLSKNNRVLMIDLDPQTADLTFFVGVEKTDDLKTMADVLKANHDINDTIIELSPSLSIVPANGYVGAITDQAVKFSRMRNVIDEVSDRYDYVFIDVNPNPNRAHALALMASDYVLVPMLPDVTSLEGNKGIAESVAEVQDVLNPDLKVLGIIFDKYKSNRNLSKEVRAVADQIAETMNTKVFSSVVRDLSELSECVAQHKPVIEYAPKSEGAKDIAALVEEFEKEINK
jgi:chromosome partitioning protein